MQPIKLPKPFPVPVTIDLESQAVQQNGWFQWIKTRMQTMHVKDWNIALALSSPTIDSFNDVFWHPSVCSMGCCTSPEGAENSTQGCLMWVRNGAAHSPERGPLDRVCMSSFVKRLVQHCNCSLHAKSVFEREGSHHWQKVGCAELVLGFQTSGCLRAVVSDGGLFALPKCIQIDMTHEHHC